MEEQKFGEFAQLNVVVVTIILWVLLMSKYYT